MLSNIDKTQSPKVGIQVLVEKDGKFLIGKDTKKGKDIYGVPGGKWENGETLQEGAIREVLEKSGILCEDLQVINVYDFFRADKSVSYVSIGYVAKYKSGKLTDNMEEGRLEWMWLDLEKALKLNLYPAGKVLIETYLSKQNIL